MAIGVKTTTTYFLKDHPIVPVPGDTISTTFPYAAVFQIQENYYALVVSAGSLSYLLSGTSEYILSTVDGYELYVSVAGQPWSKNSTVTDDSFIWGLANGGPFLWTNHDILNYTTKEVYMAAQPTGTTTEETTMVFPDAPKDYLVKYPYAFIIGIPEYSIYVLIVADEPVYFYPKAVTGGDYDFIEYIDSVGNGVQLTLSSDASSWTDPYEQPETSMGLPVGSVDGATYKIYWSNYDIKTMASETYATDEVFAPTPDETVTFPEIPADVLADYPYAKIYSYTDGENVGHGLILCAEPAYYYPMAATGNDWDSIDFIDWSGDYATYSLSEDASSWVSEYEGANETLGFPVGTIEAFGMTYYLRWSNYDIKIAGIEYIATNETYDPGLETFIIADRYSAPETFFVGMADNVRRLTGSTARLTIDRIESELDEVAEILALEDSLLTRTITEFSDETLDYVGDYAFYHCESLASVNLPALTSVGDYAFGHCLALTALDFPLLNSVGDYAFFACDAITTVSFPLLKEGVGLFRASSALTSVDLPSLTTISKDMFYNCEALTAINAPNATSIGEYAFYGCEALESIVFPLATSVDCNRTFYNCAKLKSIDFRSGNVNMYNVSSYAQYHLSGCSALEAYILRGGTAAGASTAAAAIFEGTPIASGNGYIYVKASEVDGYKSKWSTYADKIRAIEDFSVDGTATGELDWDKIAAAATATTDETIE